MARVVRGTPNPLFNMERRTHFHRAMELNLTIGSDTFRDLIKTFLNKKGATLKEHLNEKFVKEKLKQYESLCGENFDSLCTSDPSLEQMDITVLSLLILNTFPAQLKPDVKKLVKSLRSKRNELAHTVKAELNDDSLFKESWQMIVSLARGIGPTNDYALALIKTINELRTRELVNSRSNLERVRINNEVFVIKMVESTGTERVDSDGTMMIKVGMTKWVKQLSRGLNVGVFIRKLKDEGVINDTLKRQLEEQYSYEEQMQELVLHMVNEIRYNLSKFCKCLREIAPQLADLVENTNTDGREIDKYLNEYEDENMVRVLRENFIDGDDRSVSTDQVHITVEQEMGVTLDFMKLRKCVLDSFSSVRHLDSDDSFASLTWKTMRNEADRTLPKDNPCQDTVKVCDMSCEEFANYVAETLSKVKVTLFDPFKTAFENESISPNAFVDMTKDEMKETFEPFLGTTKFGIGLQKSLIQIQRQIKSEKITNESQNEEMLRPFDTPSKQVTYNKCKVSINTGNLLVPKHEFRFFPSSKVNTRYYITKEVVRFAVACINGRKNGTIHFGIKPLTSQTGEIIGVAADSECLKGLNCEIARSVEVCFKENASVALRCIRPVQIIPVEGGTVVIEVDVVPFSKHINIQLMTIDFPPKGNQHQQCFVYEFGPECQIIPITTSKIKHAEELYCKVLQERQHLENDSDTSGDKTIRLKKKLVKMLTGGNKYITDEFVPIIVSGKMGKKSDLRNQFDMERAYTSAKLVLDCDSSVKLRNKVEGDRMLFTVKTAEDLMTETDLSHTSPTWVYCNGNEELSKEAMTMDDWLEDRHDGVKNALELMKKLIPKTRAKVIFLLFQGNSRERDPLYEIARMAFVSSFRNRCIVIAENDEITKDLKKELIGTIDESKIDNFFHTGLSWRESSQLINSVCRRNPDVVCKLPHCDGHFVEMTKKEREDLKFTDVDILGGEECMDEETKMSNQERKTNRNETQERFYRGGQVSWWSFHYQTHVGKRDLFERHKNEINEKLTGNKGEALIEIHDIEHHPGAGGSTLGRHLLWHFSQFKQTPERAYRCCAVRNINVAEDTINQIEKFRYFKDGDFPKPFIVLADNKSEDNIILLKTRLHELAYKTGCPGKLFCLIIVINRMPITHDETEGKPLLKHKLSSSEQNWFESKYKEMEKSDDIDVKTLIAFNFMRKSFNSTYMKTTVERIMQGVSKKEMDVLKCLSLISSYESDHPVPENVFDYMMNEQIDMESLAGQPWGIVHSSHELQNIAKLRNDTWNMNMSDAMSLLITKKEDQDFSNSGVCLISQMLAKSVIDYIKRNEGLTLESIVDSLLDLVQKQQKETNPMSKQFVNIVCSLFKTRQLLESERGDLKEKFLDLVLELHYPVDDDTGHESSLMVLRVMQRCFDITEDAMVGQQLARFNIHIKEFDAAETAIKLSLDRKPQSSYLLDTYGQIFKSKMEYLIENSTQNENKINDDVGSEIINLASKAIEKFKEGQEIAVSQEDDTHLNLSCFHNEVKTALFLLEKFEKFESFTSLKDVISFLNENSYEVNNSQRLGLMGKCQSLENFKSGTPAQCHLETSLRILEERNYQVKKKLYTIYSGDETLYLRLRERFERFYGSRESTGKYQFTYGIGLKQLMVAREHNENLLTRRVKEAKEKLETISLSQADERDLLVYLGNEIITVSSQVVRKDTHECSHTEYRRLLSYSTRLVSIQTTSPRSKRLHLETFLYFAMLHWPLKSRTSLDLDVLARPTVYGQLIKQWEESYNANFDIKSSEQVCKNRPKNYFALGKGSPGNDIVDVESIRKEWMNRKKKSTGRVRKPVFADVFWRESFVEERLERLEGTVDGYGHVVVHKAEYPQGLHIFKINTYYPCTELSNRLVTFVLGFTWKGPTALDVEEKGKKDLRRPGHDNDDSPSRLNSENGNDCVQGFNENSEKKQPQNTSVGDGASSGKSMRKPGANANQKEKDDKTKDSGSTDVQGAAPMNQSAPQSSKKSRRQRKNSKRRKKNVDGLSDKHITAN